MKTILVANQKGGVGKTTIADEIAFGLERRGHTVCFYNLDPQGSVLHELSMPKDDDDFQVIDTPPTLTKDFSNWCRNADIIVMPTSASMLELTPLQRCYELAQKSGTKAPIGIVVNNYAESRTIDRDFVQFLHNASMPLFGTIPTTTAIRQAQAAQISVVEYKKNNAAAVAFDILTDKIMEVLK
jgi:chromosome partitioning protein